MSRAVTSWARPGSDGCLHFSIKLAAWEMYGLGE